MIVRIRQSFFGTAVIGSGAYFGLIYTYFPTTEEFSQLERYLASLVAGLCFVCLVSWRKYREEKKWGGSANIRNSLKALKLSHNAGTNLVNHLVKIDEDRFAIGHCINTPGPISSLSTAYALNAILCCPSKIDNAPIRQLTNFLLSSRIEGGWKSSSQREPRAEVTADVLTAIIAVSGKTKEYLEGIESILLDLSNNPDLMNQTYFATTVFSCLCEELELASTQLGDLFDRIISGFIYQAKGSLGYWTGTLGANRESNQPSPAFTARCLLAIKKHPELAHKESVVEKCQSAINWLLSIRTFSNETSQINRNVGSDGLEIIVNHHFSSALVAMAACQWKELDGAPELANIAMLQVTESFGDGFWMWDDGCQAVWMNFQGINASNLYAQFLSESLLNNE